MYFYIKNSLLLLNYMSSDSDVLDFSLPKRYEKDSNADATKLGNHTLLDNLNRVNGIADQKLDNVTKNQLNEQDTTIRK